METTTNREGNMTAMQTEIERIYTTLKMVDRLTPGRTPWQTLKARAEQMAAEKMLGEEDRVS